MAGVAIFRPAPGAFGAQAARNMNDTAIARSGGLPTGIFAPTGGGLTPEQQRMAELQGDPGFAAAQNSSIRNANDLGSTRQATIRALAMQFGGLPQGFQDKYGDIDPATLAAARANPYSQTAQDAHDFAGQQAADRDELASRGAGDSGATVGVGQQEDYQHGLNLYNLGNQFGSSVGSALSAYTSGLNDNANNMADATFKAEQAQAANPAYASTSNTVTAPPTNAAPARLPIPAVVRGSTGRPLFRSNVGNPFAARTAARAF